MVVGAPVEVVVAGGEIFLVGRAPREGGEFLFFPILINIVSVDPCREHLLLL